MKSNSQELVRSLSIQITSDVSVAKATSIAMESIQSNIDESLKFDRVVSVGLSALSHSVATDHLAGEIHLTVLYSMSVTFEPEGEK